MKRLNWMLALVFILCGSASFVQAQATKPAAPRDPEETFTRVYDVRDLLIQIPDYPFAGRIGAPSDTDVMMVPGAATTSPDKPRQSRAQASESLNSILKEVVAADSWRDAGGTIGVIREVAGLLVITQTRQNHDEIERVLGELRESHGRTIRVQATWILLKPEELPVLYVSDPKQGPATKNGLRLVSAEALEKNLESHNHFRAELSCFNGQTVSMSSGRTRTVITEQQPVVAQSAVAMAPNTKQVQVGAMLEVTPTLEAAMDFAVVDIHSEVADWTDGGKIEVAPQQIEVGAQDGAMTNAAAPASIDRLNLLSQQFKTTARIPVGPPVLIGGMTLEPSAGEAAGEQLYLVLQINASR